MWRYRQLIDYGMDIKKELEEYEESIIQILFKSGSSYGQQKRKKFIETLKYIFSHNKSAFEQEDYVDLIKRFTQIGEDELVKFLCSKIENQTQVLNDNYQLHMACEV